MPSMKSFVVFVVLLAILSISSCSNVGIETRPTIILTETIPDLATATRENTATPVATEITPEPVPLSPVKTQCVGDPKETRRLDLSGVVAFENAHRSGDLDIGFFMLNLKNGNNIRAIEAGLYNYVSPDGKYLAYIDTRQYFLNVLDGNGKTITQLPFTLDGRDQSFFNWQNSEQVRTIQQNSEWSISIQLLDPFTQQHIPLRTDWKDVYTPENPFKDSLVIWKFDNEATDIYFVYGANILYDPTITRVLYPKDDNVVSLVNVETETELASAQFQNWGHLPSWSPNGDYLTIVNREENVDEFYLVSRDGNEFQRITNFSKEFDFASISEAVWSPDSKQIAFWLKLEDDGQPDGSQSELAILDVASRQVTRLCVQGISNNAYKPWTMNHPEPIWSPGGRYIMITQWDDSASPKRYYVLVVDPSTGAIEKIAENTAPIGWMISEP